LWDDLSLKGDCFVDALKCIIFDSRTHCAIRKSGMMGERGEAVRSYCKVSAIFDLELHTYFTALRTCKGDRDTKAVLTTEALVSNNDSSISTRELYSVFYFLDLLVKLVLGCCTQKKRNALCPSRLDRFKNNPPMVSRKKASL